MSRKWVQFGLCLTGLVLATPLQAGTITYSYDVLGRLVQVVYPDGTTIQYVYDANGNRTAYVVTGSPNPPPAG